VQTAQLELEDSMALVAKRDTYGIDGFGVRRQVIAGDPIPVGLTVEADDTTDSGSSSSSARKPDEASRVSERGAKTEPEQKPAGKSGK
jgi:hypothetical protein